MTRDFIEITFGNAIAQAKELDACADSMESIAKGQLCTIQGNLSGSWQGENANEYFQKMDLTGNNILATAEKLRQIAETLRKVARIFRETETKALEIATQRTYGS